MDAAVERIVAAVSQRPGLYGFLGLCIAFKLYYRFTIGWCCSNRRLDGLTAIVTGGNSGEWSAHNVSRRYSQCN